MHDHRDELPGERDAHEDDQESDDVGRRFVIDAREQRIRDIAVEEPGEDHSRERRPHADDLADEARRERRHDEVQEDHYYRRVDPGHAGPPPAWPSRATLNTS